MPTTTPTQVKRPWRTTVRTAFQFILGLALILPFMVEATGLNPEVYPWLAGILGVAAGFARVMALPQVEAFLRRFLPFLAAEPDRPDVDFVRGEHGAGELRLALIIIGAIVAAWLLIVLLGRV